MAFDAATSGNAVNQVQFTYNDFGQSIQTFQEHGGTVNTGTTPSVQRGYANGSTNTVRPLSLTYPNGRELTYDYGTTHEINDALSRIGSIVDDDTTHLVDYEFLGLAGVIQQTSPQPNLRYTLAGVSNDPDTGDIYTGLDRFGRVKDSRWFNTSTNDDLSRIQYGYDRASNRIWRKNPIATANSAEYDWLYTYDGLQRLKTANRGTLNGTQTALTSTAFKQDWNLDPTGNWEGFKQSDNGSTWSMEQERTANPVNEITDISNTVGSAWADPAYNAVGNMTTIPKPKQMDESYTATYDAWNRLVKLEEEVSSILETVAEYQYDARNFRIVVNNYESGVLDETIHAYFNDGWQNIEERLNPNSTLSQQHVWGLRYIDDCVLRDRTVTTILDERLYALQDANWNVTTIVDGTGDVEERFEYDVYGMKTSLSSFFENQYSTNNEWKTTYCGYVWDKETGLFSVRNRFYHKDVGVWNSRDPLGPLDGMNLYESLFSPNVTDPLGLVKGKAFGYVVRRVGSTLIRVRSIKSREAAAMCFAKGSDILITSGRKAAQNVAETLKGRIGKKAGRLMEHQGHPLPGGVTGLPHFQFDDIPYRHIFYSGLAALFSAGAVEASEDSSCLSDCTIEVDDIYEYTMEEDTIFKALTFSYYFGDNSTISYLDWVNPGELVAAGAQIGRDLDRYATSKLVGSMLTISCSDGTEATVTVDLDGNLRSVSMDMDGIPGFETLPGVEYLDKLERGEAPPIPGIPNGK